MGKPELGEGIGEDAGDDLEIELKSTRPLTEEPPPPPSRQGAVGIRAVGEVLDEIGRHVRVDTSVEQGGVLVGHVDEATGTTVVTGSIVAVGAVSQVASLTFTHETWDHVNEVLASEYPDDQMVGWYHSHPRFGIFLSEYDQFIHNNFFPAPHHIAYVVDPVDDEHGFFGWDDGTLVRIPRWETVRVEDGRRPEADVGQPVRSDRGPMPPPVVVQTGNDGVKPGMVGLLVVLVALLVGTIAYVLGGSGDDEAAVAAPVTEAPPDTSDAPDPDPGPDPAPTPVPVPEPVFAVTCQDSPLYWPILRSAPDDSILLGEILASGVTGLTLTDQRRTVGNVPWVVVQTPQGVGWLREDVLVEVPPDTAPPTCSYEVAATVTSSLSVRSGPGVNNELQGSLVAGQAVEPLGGGSWSEGRPWVHIQAGDIEGYVAGNYLALTTAPG